MFEFPVVSEGSAVSVFFEADGAFILSGPVAGVEMVKEGSLSNVLLATEEAVVDQHFLFRGKICGTRPIDVHPGVWVSSREWKLEVISHGAFNENDVEVTAAFWRGWCCWRCWRCWRGWRGVISSVDARPFNERGEASEVRGGE